MIIFQFLVLRKFLALLLTWFAFYYFVILLNGIGVSHRYFCVLTKSNSQDEVNQRKLADAL